MGNLGDLSQYMSEKGKITDYSWLDVDTETYKNVPVDDVPSYNAIPKLEEQWKHLEDKNINLVPNKVVYDKAPVAEAPRMPEKDQVLELIKKEMMSGKKGASLLESITPRVSSSLLVSIKEDLKKLASEQGLLGNVYVDPTPFSSCELGRNFLGNKSKLAKYVLAMDKCSECMHNGQGRCALYKKQITASISYDADLFSFYESHLSQIKGAKVKISSKEDLRKLFNESLSNQPRMAEFKPVDTSKELTLEDKEKQFGEQYSAVEKSLSDIKEAKIASDLALKLLAGSTNTELKSYIRQAYAQNEIANHKNVFNNILSKQGSLGKIYIEASMLPVNNCFEAKNLFRNHPQNSLYLVDNQNFCQCGNSTLCNHLNKPKVKQVSDIPHNVWQQELNKYSSKVVSKIQKFFSSNKEQGLRLAFIQKDILDLTPAKDDIHMEVKAPTCDSINVGTSKIEDKVKVSSAKIAIALGRGYPLSAIAFASKDHVSKDNFIAYAKEALVKVGSVNSYQLDFKGLDLPTGVKLVKTSKDIVRNASVKVSVPAGYENMVEAYGLESPTLSVDEVSKKEDIEVCELNQFNIF